MNGHRFTQIYTLSSHASPFLSPVSPSQAPQIHGLDYHGRRRASERGGDFFELIPSPSSGVAICMGSVPSHGPDFHATFFCASIDPIGRELRYLNAGHEPALLFRKRQNRAIRLENTGTALRLGQDAIPLEPGDLLAVFSAGVAGTIDTHGRAFGSAGVLAILRRSGPRDAAGLVDEILRAAEDHAGWSKQSRDRTVAVVRFTGSEEQATEAEAATELSFAAA